MTYFERMRLKDRFAIRGTVFFVLGLLGLLVEVLLRPSPQEMVILLYFGLMVISVAVIFMLKDPRLRE
ncbi:MAG: hypothetical protein GXO76_11025 [Calditrichaeota bacterium]|nr:hypothetical protein [Calditrichota bacterium]